MKKNRACTNKDDIVKPSSFIKINGLDIGGIKREQEHDFDTSSSGKEQSIRYL